MVLIVLFSMTACIAFLLLNMKTYSPNQGARACLTSPSPVPRNQYPLSLAACRLRMQEWFQIIVCPFYAESLRNWSAYAEVRSACGRRGIAGVHPLTAQVAYCPDPLVAEAKFAVARDSPDGDCSMTVADAHSSIPLLFATSSTILVSRWSFTMVRLV